MPSTLHRLNARKTILSALLSDFRGVKVISREEGVIDVVVRKQSGLSMEAELLTIVRHICTGNGIEFDLLSSNANDTVVGLRFTNALMREQRLWGARGMSRAARIARGIEVATTAPNSPTSTEQDRVAMMVGEIEPDEEPVLVAAGDMEPDEPSETRNGGETDSRPVRRRNRNRTR